MTTKPPDNVIKFRRDVPSARLRWCEASDKRASCRHINVEIWQSEPVLACADCGAMVDPYAWIRDLTREWDAVEAQRQARKRAAEREIADLEKHLRALRGEFQNERERREAERAIAVLPPQRRVRR